MPWKWIFPFALALPVFSQFAQNQYILVLEDQPVSERFAGADGLRSSGASVYRTQVESRQRDLARSLEARHIGVTSSVSTLFNGIFVTATPDRLAELQSLPGVRAVIPQHAYKYSLNRAGTLVNIAAAWSAVGGVQSAGAGMKIGIIDTGIDQTHPAFQDSALTVPSGYPKCNVQSDCTNFTNNKVIVARSYVSMLSKGSGPADSKPDDL